MSNKFKAYNKELKEKIKNFECAYGLLPEAAIKHFFDGQHNMILEDSVFLDPDLEGLKNYENWLNERD